MTKNQQKFALILTSDSVDTMPHPDNPEVDSRFEQQHAAALHSAPLLAELPESQLHVLAAKAIWQTHRPGSYIVNQNDHSEMIYVIVSGFVKISRHERHAYPPHPGGLPERRKNSRRQLVVALRGPGDIVGEVPSILETGMTTDALALTTCQVVSIPCNEFLVCIRKYPLFAQTVTCKIARNRVQTEQKTLLNQLPCG